MVGPGGTDMMSGSILYPSTRDDCEAGIVFIETSGCLPMCGHGTIGTVTVALERGPVTPRVEGTLKLDAPAGVVTATYTRNGPHIDAVRIRNIASYLHATEVEVECPDLGTLVVDVAYGGNFYAIVEPQKNYQDIAELSPAAIQRKTEERR